MQVLVDQLCIGGSITNSAIYQTHVNQFVEISLAQIMQHRGIVQICQIGHIFSFFVFGRIHLAHQVLLEVLGLQNRIKFFVCRSVIWSFAILAVYL